jgi:molybdate transport system substrate-binding protein
MRAFVPARLRRAAVWIALVAAAAFPAHAQATGVLVFAAASLKNALEEINLAYEREHGRKATASFAASSALARQIEAGAPADVFISADLAWMDYLEARSLVRSGTRSDLLGNGIVLVAPASGTLDLAIGPSFELARALGADGRLAIADPGSVPAGKYAKAALETLGAWQSVRHRLAPAENVRAALLLVARGEAPLGIVYRTDVAAERKVKVIGTFPPETHPPITYPVAITAGSTNPDAASYLAYLRSAAARPAFEKQGFAMVE